MIDFFIVQLCVEGDVVFNVQSGVEQIFLFYLCQMVLNWLFIVGDYFFVGGGCQIGYYLQQVGFVGVVGVEQ